MYHSTNKQHSNHKLASSHYTHRMMSSPNIKSKNKPPLLTLHTNQAIILFLSIILVITSLALFHLHAHPPTYYYACTDHQPPGHKSWSGDLRLAEFSWNHLEFSKETPPPISLKIAVFSRKWPTSSTPGGMERHARTLHNVLARRGHRVHVYTSPPDDPEAIIPDRTAGSGQPEPAVHWHEGEPGRWRYNKAWEQFQDENRDEPFDAIHSESVSLPYWLARDLPNLAVSWHGIALESLQSSIYQDMTRKAREPMSPSFNQSLQWMIHKVLDEIRFFSNYAHHVATSDSCGEMLRDVYQIPSRRVHVIVNGVNEDDFIEDHGLGLEFRSKIGIPANASLVLGVSGRLVKDKGHPLLYEAFSKLTLEHPDVYLVVVGSGPWRDRYRELGPRVVVLGSMSSSELRPFYNAIDVFLNPTLRPQGVDQTILEAMMSGKPIMASRLPSIKGTVVVDDKCGFMFAPNVESLREALEVVVGEGAERMSERGRACRRFASYMFTATKMALAYERLFLCVKNETYCMYT